MQLQERYAQLKNRLKAFGSVLVAFSGGVDSTLLARAAYDALGENACAVTVVSDLMPMQEVEEAKVLAKQIGISHHMLYFDALSVSKVVQNGPRRCYYCKKQIFTRLLEAAASHGLNAVLEGSNTDDLGDYRPGMEAVRALSIQSPLLELAFSKDEIRALSQYLGLPTYNKPSYACLASRVACNEPLTHEKLSKIGRAEAYLHTLGFLSCRVRVHQNLARIELNPADFEQVLINGLYKKISQALLELGFDYVTLDLQGYQTGSMNLKTNPKKDG